MKDTPTMPEILQTETDVLNEIFANNGTWLQGENGRFLDSKILAHLVRRGEIEHHGDDKYHTMFQRGGKKRYYITVGGLCALWEAHGCRGLRPTYPASLGQFMWVKTEDDLSPEEAGRLRAQTIADAQRRQRRARAAAQRECNELEAAQRRTKRLQQKEENRLAKQRLRDLKQYNQGKRS